MKNRFFNFLVIILLVLCFVLSGCNQMAKTDNKHTVSPSEVTTPSVSFLPEIKDTNTAENTDIPDITNPQSGTPNATDVETTIPEVTSTENVTSASQNPTSSSTPTVTPKATTKAPTTTQTTTKATTQAVAKTPEPTTVKPTITNPQPSASGFVNEVHNLVNQERAKAGKPALTLNSAMCSRADIRANEICTHFQHKRPDGTEFWTVLSGISYTLIGENIAMGQTSPEAVMNSWMNSSSHKANILGDYDQIGISAFYSGNAIYWVQLFIKN